MDFPRYLVAKYVSDLGRMEPRNIGLFLWWKGSITMRFLEREEAASFIDDEETYMRWLEFWKTRVSGDSVAPTRGKPIAKNDPQCLEALLSTQKGQYLLVDAGELLDPIRKRDAAAAVDYLFSEIVAMPQETKGTSREPKLRQLCDRLFEKSGLASRGDFRQRYPLEISVFGGVREFRFSYGIGNGTPSAVFQNVRLSTETSVNSAALMLHEVTDKALLDRRNCGALIRGSDIISDAAEQGRNWLSKICEVVDVEAPDAADHIQSLAPSTN